MRALLFRVILIQSLERTPMPVWMQTLIVALTPLFLLSLPFLLLRRKWRRLSEPPSYQHLHNLRPSERRELRR
jgi:hypothetical protein